MAREPIDLKIEKAFQIPYYDISFADDGDFETIEGMSTSIQMSFFGQRRASESEMPAPETRRGWWGNELSRVPGYEVGNKLWLLYQSRNTQQTANLGVSYIQAGFQWYLDDALAKKVTVDSDRSISDNKITFNITIFRSNDEVLSSQFELWEKTTLDHI